jgi:hypothetical protein
MESRTRRNFLELSGRMRNETCGKRKCTVKKDSQIFFKCGRLALDINNKNLSKYWPSDLIVTSNEISKKFSNSVYGCKAAGTVGFTAISSEPRKAIQKNISLKRYFKVKS